MRMLKYVLVFILVVILAGIAVVPWIDGYYFRKAYLQNLAKFNFGTRKLQVVQYRLGWLSSNVKLHITDPTAPHPTVGIWVNQHIIHGPYIHDALTGWTYLAAEIKTQLSADPEFLTYLYLNVESAPQVNLDTFIFFNGKMITRLDIVPVNFVTTNKAPVKVAWQGAEGALNMLGANGIASDLTIKPLLLQLKQGDSFSLQNVTTHIALQCKSSVGCDKSFAFSTPRLSLNGNGKKIDIADISFAFSVMPDSASVINSKFKIAFNKFTIGDFAFGPLALNVDVENLDMSALRKLEGAVFLARANAVSRGLTPNAAMLSALNGEAYHIVTKGMSLSQDMQFSTPYGNLVSKGKAFWPTEVPLPTNAMEFTHNVNLQVEVHVADSLMDQVLQKIAEQMDAAAAANAKKLAATPAAVGPHNTEQDTADFKKQIDLFVSQKQLSASGRDGILFALKTHSTTGLFSLNVQQGLARQQVTTAAAAYLNTQYAKIEDDRAKDLAAIFAKPVTDDQDLQDRVNALAAKGYISSATATRLILLLSQNLDDSIFSAFVKNLATSNAVTLNVADLLSKAYLQLKGEDTTDTASSGAQTAKMTTLDKVKKFIDSNIEKGYITHDSKGYSSVVTFDHGALKINGVPFDIPKRGAPAAPAIPLQQPAGAMGVHPAPGQPGATGMPAPAEQPRMPMPAQQPAAPGMPAPQQPGVSGMPTPAPTPTPTTQPLPSANAPMPPQPAPVSVPAPSNSVPATTPAPIH
ncbi:MAG: DUF945 family protein [Gammaproteobacteria bacterium]|nr:DUF945 family protein [Gammaproteobacteria bacterium]